MMSSTVWLVFEQLGQFLSSARRLQFLALWLTLDGLLCEVFGVFVLVAPDYDRVRHRLRAHFDFHRVTALEELREWVNDTRTRLRQDASFDTAGQFREVVLRCDADRRFLSYLVFLESQERPPIATSGFVAQADNPSLTEIALHVETAAGETLTVDDATFRRRYEKGINRAYYRQGAWLILLGFGLMIVATILQIVTFWL
jgi:hypothetical protein